MLVMSGEVSDGVMISVESLFIRFIIKQDSGTFVSS